MEVVCRDCRGRGVEVDEMVLDVHAPAPRANALQLTESDLVAITIVDLQLQEVDLLLRGLLHCGERLRDLRPCRRFLAGIGGLGNWSRRGCIGILPRGP